jgi:hypothetical protein
LLVGLACGTANGMVITRLHVPDLIATLSMDLVYRGLALVLAAGAVLARFPEPIPTLGRGRLFELVPVPVVIGLIVLAIGYVLYRHTSLGRYAIAIGGNEEAATLTGIRVRPQQDPPLHADGCARGARGDRDHRAAQRHSGDLGHRPGAAHLLATSPSPGSAAPATAASGLTTRRRSHIIATGAGMSQPFAGL